MSCGHYYQVQPSACDCSQTQVFQHVRMAPVVAVPEVIDYTDMTDDAKIRNKVRQMRAGIRFGCHVDLGPGDEPDGCVIDAGRPDDCALVPACRGCKELCPEWRPIITKEPT